VAAVVWLLGPVLTPFAIAAVLAYALHPWSKGSRRSVPRLLRWRSSRSAP
jgi:predicted PurR-regulated permease PerM